MKLSNYNYETASPDRYELLKEYARNNRTYPTVAENLLWRYLRKQQLGVKFRRQQAINDYIADFACLEQMLIVEVDGGYHLVQQQMIDDRLRSEALANYGYRILRFSNEQVCDDIENVLSEIRKAII